MSVLHQEPGVYYAPLKTPAGKWLPRRAYTNVEDLIANNQTVFLQNNSYITVHQFATDKGRKNENCSAVNGVYIDLDFHDNMTNLDAAVDDLKKRLQECFAEEKIPVPTMVNFTGRGLALFYLYEQAIPVDDEIRIHQHTVVYDGILSDIQAAVGEFVKVDTSVKDFARVCRIAGTWNVAANRFSQLLAVYMQQGKTLRYPIEYIYAIYEHTVIPTVDKPKEKKRSRPDEKKAPVFAPKTGIYPTASNPVKWFNASQKRLKWLAEWLKLRDYDIPNKREIFCFIYYSTYVACECAADKIGKEMDNEIATVFELNGKIGLPNTELFSSVVDNTDEHDKPNAFTNETIIDLLGITDDEAELLGIHIEKERKQKVKKSAIEKLLARIQIMMWYEAGMTADDIADGISAYKIDSVRRIISEIKRSKKNELTEKILKLADEGLNNAEIATKTGCSTRQVREILRRQKTENNLILKERGCENVCFCSERAEAAYAHFLKDSEKTTDWCSVRTILHTAQAILLTGNAGTGKTTLIREFIASLPTAEQRKTLIVAPTGKAALNLNATTIHKAFHLPLTVQPTTTAPIDASLLQYRRIIVDEVSMVRVDVFQAMINQVRQIEQQTNQHVQIILIGDFKQAGPVATPKEKAAIKAKFPTVQGMYAFQSESWKGLNLTHIQLTTNFRQGSDTELQHYLNRIGYGDKNAVEWFNSHLPHGYDPHGITICPTRSAVDAVNQFCVQAFANCKQISYTAQVKGRISVEQLPCPKTLTLSVGMKVMTVVNSKHYVNGSAGTITKINPKSVVVDFQNGKPPVNIKPYSFTLDNGTKYTQLPIVLAYAITVQKSEGLTFDAVNIVPGFFDAGQLYVALTRTKNREGMHLLAPLSTKDLYANVDALCLM